MTRRLDGKVAIVTGAGRTGNIGVAICEAYLREGAKAVVATDINTAEADAITRRFNEQFGPERFTFKAHDNTQTHAWHDVVKETVDQFGALDVLVNNAGISVHGGIENTSLEDMRRVMAVNNDSLFLGMKICAPYLAESVNRFAGGGVVINTLSMASYMPSANNLAYQVSKAAGRMMTLCGAIEMGPKKIRVNSVHPGLTITPLVQEAFQTYADQGLWPSREAALEAVASMGPLGIQSQPEDTAHAFVYLASEEARFVTGASFWHDGGIGQRY